MNTPAFATPGRTRNGDHPSSTPVRSVAATRSLAALMAASLCASLLLAAPARAAVDFQDGATRRIALVIGHHDGGAGRETLVHAGSDASAFRRTLEDLGGLQAGDATLLIDPDSVRVARALDDMEERSRALKRAGQRVEAIVYYSGHADDQGFRLGAEGFAYRTFRGRLNTLGADVRIAVVDACESGALTRLKGGRPAPAFLIDQSIKSEGYAILTSSSGSEAAQESDRLGGSFFTHALNTGLRGAADASRDGKVTLHEAYHFAFNETLARTQSTRGGPQHAGYEIQLTGSGDVVLTDLREATTTLDLSGNFHGRLFIRDSLGNLTAELNKPAGADMQLGLAPGRYELRLLQASRWSTATVVLTEGTNVPVDAGLFQSGPEASYASSSADAPAPDTSFHRVPASDASGFSSAIFYDLQKEPWHGTQIAFVATDALSHRRGGQLSLAGNLTRGDLEGFQAAIGVNIGGSDVHGFQIAQLGNVAGDDMRGAQIAAIFGVAGGHVQGGQGSGIFNVAGKSVDGGQIAGIFNVAGDTVKGFQIAGISNAACDSVRGGQGAGIINIAGGSLRGGQGAGILNIVGRDLKGGHGAGIGNIVGGNVKGGQGAGIFNLVGGDVKGGQGAGIFNLAGGDVKGGQGAGIANIVGGDAKGGQGAGIANIVGGDVKGGQGAGILNIAGGEMQGVQVAGIVNASWALRGFQIAGIANIAGKVNGYQIGLINIADEYESGVPIGLVNISRKGGVEGEAWIEENGFAFAGMRFGSRWMHSQLAVGTRKVGTRWVVAPTLGAAGELALGASPLYLETGLVHSSLFVADGKALNADGVTSDWTRLRVGLGWKVLPYTHVVGGLSYNVAVHHDTDTPVGVDNTLFMTTFSDRVSLWPGAWVGVRFGK